MPTPIPEWDRLRVIVRYLAQRQGAYKETTLKQASNRLGIAASKVQELLIENNISYLLIPLAEDATHKDTQIVLEPLPKAVAESFKIDNSLIMVSCSFFKKREIKLKPKKDKRKETFALRRSEKEKIKKEKLRYFLAEEETNEDIA